MRRGAAHAGRPRRQDGIAAIELALILLFFMGLLPVALLFGRVMLAYAVVQKATHDAARYMATLSPAEMIAPDEVDRAVAQAAALVLQATAGMNPPLQRRDITILCSYGLSYVTCGSGVSGVKPSLVSVAVNKEAPNDFLQLGVQSWMGVLGALPLYATSIQRYAN